MVWGAAAATHHANGLAPAPLAELDHLTAGPADVLAHSEALAQPKLPLAVAHQRHAGGPSPSPSSTRILQ